MPFYIAELNRETGRFELWHSDDKVNEMYDESEALSSYERAIKLEGSKNVILLEEVIVDVKLSVKRYNPDDAEQSN